MTRILAAAFLALAALPAQATTCLINIEGTTYFDGPCRFLPYGGDGSFRIISNDGWSLAEVSLLEPGMAEGWWNESTGSSVATTPLGMLYRDQACWVNGYATICAW
jgi:hypothetical protein